MPPVKLYKLPGTPGSSLLCGGQSDKGVNGTPSTPLSRPTPGSGSTPAQPQEQHLAPKPKPSHGAHPAAPAQPRPYCVFCRCNNHWSSDCPTTDFHARWAFVKDFQRCQQCLRAGHIPADCFHSNRRCLHCAARHHAALCPKAHGPAFQPAATQPFPGSGHPSVDNVAGGRSPPEQAADVSLNPVVGHPLAANAAEGRSPPGLGTTASSENAHQTHDDRSTTTNPLDTKPSPSSSSMQPPPVSPVAADVEPSNEHRLANAITSYFQRHSAGNDVVVGFYVRSQDNAGRTFYRILKPLKPSFQLPSAATDLYDRDLLSTVDRVIMIETIAHILPCDPLLSSNAMPDADSCESTRRSARLSACSSCCAHSPAPGVVATDFSGVAPRHATVVSELATAIRTPPLLRPDALSPPTVDSASNAVEPENTCATSRRFRRKRPRRQPNGQTRSTSSTQSTPFMTMGSRADLITPPGLSDPAQQPLADSKASGTPLVPLESVDDQRVQHPTPPPPTPATSEGPMPLKKVRIWTASSRKKPLPEPSPPTITAITPHTTEAYYSPTRIKDTDALGKHASGQCQKPLIVSANAYARSPSSTAMKPIVVLFDSGVDHSSCSTLLATELHLPLGTDTAGHASLVPFITTHISILLDGEPGVTIPVTLATMPVRMVPTPVTYKRDILPLQDDSSHPSVIWIKPHIILGRDSHHLFHEMALDYALPNDASIHEGDPLSASGGTPPELILTSTDARHTPSAVRPQSGSNGTLCEPHFGHSDTHSATLTERPSSALNGTPFETDFGSADSDQSRTHALALVPAPRSPSWMWSGGTPLAPFPMDAPTSILQQAGNVIRTNHAAEPVCPSSLVMASFATTAEATTPRQATRTLIAAYDTSTSNRLLPLVRTGCQPASWSGGTPLVPMAPVWQPSQPTTATTISDDAATTDPALRSFAPGGPSTRNAKSMGKKPNSVKTVKGGHDLFVSRARQAPPFPPPIAQGAGTPVASATIDQSSVVATAAAAPGTAPATPDPAARAAHAAPALALNRKRCSMHEVELPSEVQPITSINRYDCNSPSSAEYGTLSYSAREPLDAAGCENSRPSRSTVLLTSDGTPSDGGLPLHKVFREPRFEVTFCDDHDRKHDSMEEAASPEVVHYLKQQQPLSVPRHKPSPAEDATSAMDYEQSNQEPANTGGTPSETEIPLPVQKVPPRTRASTAESSGVEVLERDESPGVLADFSVSPAPGQLADVVPFFQLLTSPRTVQPDQQPQPGTLGQALPPAAGTANVVPQPKHSAAPHEAAADRGGEHFDSRPAGLDEETLRLGTEKPLHQLIDSDAESDTMSEVQHSEAPNLGRGHSSAATAAGDRSPSVQSASTQPNPGLGHPSAATAAGGRRPPDAANRISDTSRNPGYGHPPLAAADGGRSPPSSSDTIRNRSSPSTEQRRGTPRASSRGQAAPHAQHLPWPGQQHDW